MTRGGGSQWLSVSNDPLLDDLHLVLAERQITRVSNHGEQGEVSGPLSPTA
jgi:hypothetical protein